MSVLKSDAFRHALAKLVYELGGGVTVGAVHSANLVVNRFGEEGAELSVHITADFADIPNGYIGPVEAAEENAPCGAVGAIGVPGMTREEQVAAVRTLLSDIRYRFRSLKAIEKAAGTADDLQAIVEAAGGRRASRRGIFQDKYGLISRVGRGRMREYGPKARLLNELLADPNYTFRTTTTLMKKLEVSEPMLSTLLTYVGAVQERRDPTKYRAADKNVPVSDSWDEDGSYDDDDDDDYSADN